MNTRDPTSASPLGRIGATSSPLGSASSACTAASIILRAGTEDASDTEINLATMPRMIMIEYKLHNAQLIPR